jgi:hypothetical protein
MDGEEIECEYCNYPEKHGVTEVMLGYHYYTFVILGSRLNNRIQCRKVRDEFERGRQTGTKAS